MSTISSFFGLNTALRGLLAQQQALDVSAHNIANAQTEGYTRQSAVMSASDALRVTTPGQVGSVGYVGSGVEVQQFTRIRDQFADLQFRAQNMGQGQYDTTSSLIGEAELNLSEPSDTGLSQRSIRVDFGDAANPLVNDTTVDWSPQPLSAPGGQLGALLQVGDPSSGIITGYLSDLDGFASQLASSVNAIHGAPPFFSGT